LSISGEHTYSKHPCLQETVDDTTADCIVNTSEHAYCQSPCQQEPVCDATADCTDNKTVKELQLEIRRLKWQVY